MDFKKAAVDLWRMLDDIDTFSDMAKGNNKAFREGVEEKVRERHRILESDGYNLFAPTSDGYEIECYKEAMTEQEQREILEWFSGRAGDYIKNDDYQWLLVELANVLSVISIGKKRFNSADEVCNFIART